ncbi:MazG nucleotide pyrophosphohydrolase domain-containing protein [Sphaerisporangium fuscum]|uniref:MazG nucleotide pyrophosphohydrolase domain-containing protein n=1 Tax=Sphaerisporangium fuscum TaxID=2835868 RepID=UPI001BDD8556|nr:MazG nucleotide pyrophosphohydrolase domain-containing protein [Sphaerisporangium fuscum]
MDLRQLTDQIEAVSAEYARRMGIDRDDAWFMLKLQEEVGELTQAFLMRSGQARDKGHSPEELESNFRAELADVLSQVLLLARHHGVDLETEIERKRLSWLHDRPSPREGAGRTS